MRYNTTEERFFARLITLTKYEAQKRRGLTFDISTEDLVNLWNQQQGLCSLSQQPMSFVRGSSKSRNNPDVCTIDRIDPNDGYIKSNVQLTRWQINRLKSNLTQTDFVSLCKLVANNN